MSKLDKLCWHNKFNPPRCQNIAKWHWPKAVDNFSRNARWCDKHKFPNDVLLEELEDI